MTLRRALVYAVMVLGLLVLLWFAFFVIFAVGDETQIQGLVAP
jgi:hypothetical protein